MKENPTRIVEINKKQCFAFSHFLNELVFQPEELSDKLMYPPTTFSKENIANFFFYTVAIDHQTHPKNKAFQGIINGKLLKGADLLYAITLSLLKKNPSFFDPNNILNLSENEFQDFFAVKAPNNELITIYNPNERLSLWKNAAKILKEHNTKDILTYLAPANNFLLRHDNNGILQRLKKFKAYSDPLEKKSFLLMKFLSKANLVTLKDPQNLHLPIDNHLIRLALRIGLVDVINPNERVIFLKDIPVTEMKDFEIRRVIRSAYDLVLSKTKKDPFAIDDLLWHAGRQCCPKNAPTCQTRDTEGIKKVKEILYVEKGKYCPFESVCKGFHDPTYRELREHFYRSYYY